RSQRTKPAAATTSVFNAVLITRSGVLSEQRELESALLSDRNCLPYGGRRQGHVPHPFSFCSEDLSVIAQLIDQRVSSRGGEIDWLAGLAPPSHPRWRAAHH